MMNKSIFITAIKDVGVVIYSIVAFILIGSVEVWLAKDHSDPIWNGDLPGLVFNGLNKSNGWTYLFYFTLGTLISQIRRGKWWLPGVTIFAFLLLMLYQDVSKKPTSHNLWPIEIGIYILITGAINFGGVLPELIRNIAEEKRAR